MSENPCLGIESSLSSGPRGLTKTSEIQLFSGRVIDPLNPDPDLIVIEDIAHATSMQCRFSGHVREFYSVATHSFNVSFYVPPEDALQALLHDGTEAYLCDVPSPLKHDVFGSRYREFEENLWRVIAKKFGVAEVITDAVHRADKRLLATEVRDLLPRPEWNIVEIERVWGPWLKGIIPLAEYINGESPAVAEKHFLTRFEYLTRTGV